MVLFTMKSWKSTNLKMTNKSCRCVKTAHEKSPFLSNSDNEMENSVFKSDNEEDINRAKIYSVTCLLLFAVMCERMTYYGILGNLVMFCTNDLEYSSGSAVTINLIFTAIAYFVPLLGGRIADTISGRFNIIYASFLIYAAGIVLMPVVAFDYSAAFGYDKNGFKYGLPLDYKRGYFLFSLLLIAFGVGSIKVNISPLGAQQVEPLGKNAVQSFFNWYYWFVNIGGCISCLGIVYVQQEVNFFLGYVITAAVLLLGLIVFIIPRNFYSEHSKGSVAGEVIGILWQALSYKCFKQPTKRRRIVNCLDGAKISKGGKFLDLEVDYLKYVIKTIPIFLTLIMFSTFTSQNTTTMLLQGERMNVHLGEYVVPVASLNVFKMAVIAFLIPVLDLVVYPLLSYYGKKPSMLQRIGFGMILGTGSLLYMGILEILRKKDVEANGGVMQKVGIFMYNASNISILWQVPQFVLNGLGNTFTTITALEFAYTESPVEMQGMVMGVNHLTNCLGSILGSAIYNIVADATANSGKPWLPNDINDGHLEWFVFLLAGILFLNFILFVTLARRYRYCRLGTQQPLIPRSRKDQPSQACNDSPAYGLLGN